MEVSRKRVCRAVSAATWACLAWTMLGVPMRAADPGPGAGAGPGASLGNEYAAAPLFSDPRLLAMPGAGSAPSRQIILRLPQARGTADGELVIDPNLDVLEDSMRVGDGQWLRPTTWPSGHAVDGATSASWADRLDQLPRPATPELQFDDVPEIIGQGSVVPPIFDDSIIGQDPLVRRPFWGLMRARPCEEGGLGRERLPNALFEIDTTQPFSNFRIRLASYSNWRFPNRSEYHWGRPGRGPALPERSVDEGHLRFLNEVGGSSFSVGTELPFSWVNPEVAGNHAGIGDMNLATKMVMVDGTNWQITQLFRTYFNTGSASMGLGTGHFSIEPGVLLRYKWNDITYLHGDIKYWVPLGGDPIFSGQVLEYGLGISHLLWDSDKIAVIPTLEVVAHSFLNGQQTAPTGAIQNADGRHVFNLLPGVRIARDGGSELGLVELGVMGGWAISNDHLYDSVLRVDVRWSY